ncbi:transglutaminase domain-containing protein [bacterium]|nr:transglutaminase domain-containing protein [bacterium]
MRSPDRYPWLVACLAATGLLASEIALDDMRGNVAAILLRFTLFAVVIGLFCWRSYVRKWQPHGLLNLMALAVLVSPLLVEPLWRMATGMGHALEIQLLIGFRNLSLMSLVWAQHRRFEYIAVVTSLFTILFCVSTSQDHSLVWLTGFYMLAGIGWLAGHYWSSLRTDRVVGTQTQIPWKQMSLLAVLPVIAVMAIALPESIRTRMIEGFMPSSGGTGAHDPFARSGVGDGDALVAATEKAMSFAPIEDAPFIEGNEPSLYDVYQDTYGKPKPVKKFERAISLPMELFTPNHHRMAQAKKASRTFSLDRQTPRRAGHKHLEDTESNAMLHVSGPVPAHLRHTVYDLFDGREWYPQVARPIHLKPLEVVYEDEKPWIAWSSRQFPHIRTHVAEHALRILNVDTNRILSPANPLAVHIDRCDRPDLFQWKQEDVLAMTRSELPAMSVIRVRSQLIAQSDLNGDDVSMRFGLPEYKAVPEGPGMQEIRDFAAEWTQDAETDWQRVCAIRDRLKSEYTLDADVVVPDNCENPVLWFLKDSKRGPDYLFATATIMLCRSEGISCRAVSGLYANPAKFDVAKQQTSVHPSDVHWWAEVYAGPDHWAVVEACPGFHVRQPPRSWLQAIQAGLWGTGRVLVVYWPVSLLLIGIASFAFHNRRVIVSRLLMWNWDLRRRFNAAADARELLNETAVCYDRRCRLQNNPRPQHRSLAALLNEEHWPTDEFTSQERRQLAAAMNWACYAPVEAPLENAEEVNLTDLCRRLVHSKMSPRQADVLGTSL